MGKRGDRSCPLPRVPHLLHPNGEIKSPQEGERSTWAAEDQCSGRGLGVAGPGLRRRPVTRRVSLPRGLREGPRSARGSTTFLPARRGAL